MKKTTVANKMAGKVVKTSAAPHVVVIARAGTGKTTTLVCGLQKLRGETPYVLVYIDPFDPGKGQKKVYITPSEQQQIVWDQLSLTPTNASVCFVAFNKSIATELQQRVPQGCQAMTMHSMGLKAVTAAYGRVQVNSYRCQDIIAELLEQDIRDLRRNEPVLVSATEKLTGLCKMNLCGIVNDVSSKYGEGSHITTVTEEDLEALATYHDIDLNGTASRVFDLVPRVLERARDVTRDKCIDFNDMIWIPVAMGLSVWQYDLLLVDEAQDLNRCQQALAKKAGKRLVLCGDPAQAIYGFAGADCESIDRMVEELSSTPLGVRVLPLTVTRRCGKAIVKEANKIVKDFDAYPDNPPGQLRYMAFDGPLPDGCYDCSGPPTGSIEEFNASWKRLAEESICDEWGGGEWKRVRFEYETAGWPKDIDTFIRQRANIESKSPPFRSTACYRFLVADGDMVLCRVNAPLVSQCFRFLKLGRKANIQGKDIGAGLVSLIKKMKTENVAELAGKLDDWYHKEANKEHAKRNPSEAKLIALSDRVDCIACFSEGTNTVADIINKIEAIFTDDRNGSGIRLSSIHKAKGLESHRVFLLEPEGSTVPHPMAKSGWQVKQEWNLRYVAITRAISELVFVS